MCLLPALLLLGLLKKAEIALVAAGGDLSGLHRSADCAPFFPAVGAAAKAAPIQVWGKIPECGGDLVLIQLLHSLSVKGREAGRVCGKSAAEPEELHVTCGMSAAAELLAHLAYLQGKVRSKSVEDTGLSNSGIACKGGYLAR